MLAHFPPQLTTLVLSQLEMLTALPSCPRPQLSPYFSVPTFSRGSLKAHLLLLLVLWVLEILLPHSLSLSSGHLSVSSSSVTGAPLEPAGWFGKPRRSLLRWPSPQGQTSHDFCPSLPLITSAQLSHRAVSPVPVPPRTNRHLASALQPLS